MGYVSKQTYMSQHYTPTPLGSSGAMLDDVNRKEYAAVGADWERLYGPEAQANQLAEEQAAQARTAKYENEQRYQEMLDLVMNMGAQGKSDIESSWGAAEGRGMQDLVSSGLYGSTNAPSMRQSYTRGKSADLGRLMDRLRMARLGVIEARTDAYPTDTSPLAQGLGYTSGTTLTM
jgi:hypothetical protein